MAERKVAPAPTLSPTPEAPPRNITKHEQIAYIFNKHQTQARLAIEAFRAELERNTVGQALIWKAEPAWFGEAFLSETHTVEAFIAPRDPWQKADDSQYERDQARIAEAADILRIREGIERRLVDAVEALAGGDGAADAGPWMPRSTSMMTNFEFLVKANAKRRCVRVYTEMLACIDESV